jgi:hypothetical protein
MSPRSFSLLLVSLAAVTALPGRAASPRPASPGPSGAAVDLAVLAEIDLGQPIGQLRAVPVELGPGKPKAVAALHAADAEIDPYIGMFFFPKSTLQLVVFDETGRVHWRRDLGPGVVPGVWFSPIFAWDLDQDGRDEIYLVGNQDPAHPLDYRHYVLEQIDAVTGTTLAQRPWPRPHEPASLSDTYRHFIVGGEVDGKPMVVAIQGTYGRHTLHAFGAGLQPLWQVSFDPAEVGGALGSHVTPVVDIDGDGDDELMIGERCLSLRDGRELFCCDRQAWRGHSDIVQPVFDRAQKRWYLWTCRETDPERGPRLAFFDDRGRTVWQAVDRGHMDTGWAARLGPHGEPIVLGVRIGQKVRTAEGEHRTTVEEFTFEAFTGKPVKLGFDVYTTIPVDLDGDGVHELVKGYFEGDGTVMDREGRVLGKTGGLTAINSKFTRHAGEQMLSYHRDGKVRIWHDRNAVDTAAARARYESRFYRANQKLSGVGYNLFTLGGI